MVIHYSVDNWLEDTRIKKGVNFLMQQLASAAGQNMLMAATEVVGS